MLGLRERQGSLRYRRQRESPCPNLVDVHCPDPIRVVRRHHLMEKARLVDSVVVAFHGQRTASHVRQYSGSNATVVIDQIGLGYSVPWK